MAYDETKVVNVKALKDTATRIKTEYLAAISKAGHARFQKSDTVPDAGTAEENVLYLVHNDETGHYDVYALIDGVVELLDDTTVSLDGYVTDDDLAEALNGVGGGAVYTGTKTDITSLGIPAQDTTYTDVTAGGASGLMTGADKTKMDGIAVGATKVEASTTPGNIKINGSETPVVTIATDEDVAEMLADVFPTA